MFVWTSPPKFLSSVLITILSKLLFDELVFHGLESTYVQHTLKDTEEDNHILKWRLLQLDIDRCARFAHELHCIFHLLLILFHQKNKLLQEELSFYEMTKHEIINNILVFCLQGPIWV